MRIVELKTFVVGNPPPTFGGRYFLFRAGLNLGQLSGAALGGMAPLRFELLLRFHTERGQVRLQIGQTAAHFRGARFGVFADTGGFHDILADLLRSRGQEWAAVFPDQIGQATDKNREVDPEQDRFEGGAETGFGLFLNFLRECRSRCHQARQ